MRISIFLTLACVVNVYATGYSQGNKLTLSLNDVKLSQVFSIIQQQTDYQFLYNDEDVEKAPSVSVSVKEATVPQILAICFKNYPLRYRIVNKTVVVLPGLMEAVKLPIPVKIEMPQFEVRGKVTDQSGGSLAGVSIALKGTQTGTITDAEGSYSLTLPDGNGTLVFSYIGYTQREVPVNGRSVINVSLAASATSLNQLVVTALGIKQEKRTLSYITQNVNTESLTQARELNVVNSLEGKVAGLNISQSGSGVGAPSRVTLRGNRSINGDSQPLYVIDGVPVLGYPQYLNSDNIASLNVLKGANAAALYGSDAQNGAIIITTKQGQPGGIKVSLNNTFMFQQADLSIPFQNEYAQGTGGVYQKGSGYSWGAKMEGQNVPSWTLDPSRATETYALTPQPDNVKDLFQTGFTLSNNLQASIGGKNTQAFFSATSTEAAGILPNNKLQRNNVLLRVSSKLSDRFSLDTKISYTLQKTDNPTRQSTNNFNPMQQIYDIPRNIRTQDAKKYEFPTPEGVMQQDFWSPGFSSTAENPYWVLNRNISNDHLGRITGLVSLTYKFTDDLNLMVRTAYDRIDETFEQSDYNGTLVRALYGRYTVTKSNSYEFNSDFLLSYKKQLSSDWNLDLHAGGNIKKVGNESLSSNTGDAMLVPNFFTLSNTNFPATNFNPGEPINIQSFYAFGKIGWKDAIFLDLTGRNDWSSTLPANSRSYFYPSVGLSAVLSDLIPSFPKLFSYAKVRASYAKVGSSAPAFMLQRTATFSSGGTNGFLSLSGILPNKNLKPEETRSFESGFDVRFLQGRLGLDFTYFKTNTLNQLFTVALPVASGASSFYTNGGNIQNKGVEIVLNTVPVQTKNFQWTLDLNFSHLKNTVVSISDERPKVVISSNFASDFVIQQGLDYGDIFTIGFVRDDQGRVIVGSNGVPQISNQKDFNIGSYTPDWMGGISSAFSYKALSLSFVIDHRQGGVVESFTRASLDFFGLTQETVKGRSGGLIFGSNIFPNYTAVTEDGKPNNIPVDAETLWRAIGNASLPVGEVYALDATNTRLRELIIGYSLPQPLVSRLHLSGVKVSLVGRNLFFISRATPGLDPDILTGTSTSSEGFSIYPPPTTRSFGINLKIDF
ncbi:MAG TPA: SusC/RagA family TonB-linked outer membrane protein [Chitinophagaceae bacterium]|nr:SusC/RagA family TonB-linked outer membrane protein [Chitinophagaceae bacterium]